MKMPSSNHKTSATQVNLMALRARGRGMLSVVGADTGPASPLYDGARMWFSAS